MKNLAKINGTFKILTKKEQKSIEGGNRYHGTCNNGATFTFSYYGGEDITDFFDAIDSASTVCGSAGINVVVANKENEHLL